MNDHRKRAPDKSFAKGQVGGSDTPKPRTASDGVEFELSDVVDDPARPNGNETGLSEDDEQDWEEQEAIKGASEGGDDTELDKRLSDDQEQ